jgi:PAS domain S-box-containing protein
MSQNLRQTATVTKALDGRITSWTASAQAMFGFTEAEAAGKHISIIIPFDYQDEEYDILDRIKHGQQSMECVTVRRCRDGGLLRIKMQVSPVHNNDGKLVAVCNQFELLEELPKATLGKTAK